MSVNKTILIGNTGKDPEVKVIGESKVCNVSIATSEKYKGETKTTWHNLQFWGKLAEIVEKYVKKGDQIYVEGQLDYRDYETKDGQKKSITVINCRELKMLGSKSKEKQAEKQAEKEDYDPFN
jgi:single-strand DNA-binding protein